MRIANCSCRARRDLKYGPQFLRMHAEQDLLLSLPAIRALLKFIALFLSCTPVFQKLGLQQ